MNRAWDLFSQKSFVQLWLFKLLFCGFCAWRVLATKKVFLEIAETYSYNSIPVFELLNIGVFPIHVFHGLIIALAISLILAAIGIFSRLSLLLSTIFWFLVFGNYESYFLLEERTGDSYNHSSVFIILLILLFSRNIGRLDFKFSIEKIKSSGSSFWEVDFIKIYLGLVYFLSFYSKMRFSFPWVNGYSQQAVLFRKAVQYNLDYSLYLSQLFYFCLFAGVVTIILEAGFIVGQFYRPTKWFFVFLGLSFHTFNYFFMKIGFINYFCFVYFIFAYELYKDLKASKINLIQKA